jgi:hypothetical protein
LTLSYSLSFTAAKEVESMRFLNNQALLFVCSAMCINCLFVNAAVADSATYVYRGNNFEELQGEPGVFSTKDRVTGRFTIDCSIAHPEGTCVNLPYENYFLLGAIRLESMNFSAGPASLPTVDGHADINAFSLSTDSSGQIVDWEIDLSFADSSGVTNIHTGNYSLVIDLAAAFGGDAVVLDNPGRWKKIGRPGWRPVSMFRDHNRMYGDGVGADVCVDDPPRHRCAFLWAWEDYDLKGTFQFTGIEISNWFIRHFDDGGHIEWRRWMFCHVGPDSIIAQKDLVTLSVALNPDSPECETDGERRLCDAPDDCVIEQRGFERPFEVAGEWIQPINTRKLVANEASISFDPWSETSHRSMMHCNENGGNMMTSGGFSVGSRYFPFEGFDTQGWSHSWRRSCNNDHRQK